MLPPHSGNSESIWLVAGDHLNWIVMPMLSMSSLGGLEWRYVPDGGIIEC